ncbi:kinase domain protein [Ceratobasidium sp. AG-Ba]|nr:kinase domain protein [Ceratobasidium sp. AG-Ba]
MSGFNFAYTVPFPKDSKLTMKQVFEALRVKCREPTKFVGAFSACEVLEETPTYIKRRVTTTAGRVEVEEIDLYAPTMAVFKGEEGKSIITNIVSEAEDGSLFLTLTFEVKDGAWFAKGLEHALALAKAGTHKSVEVTLEMLEKGELN